MQQNLAYIGALPNRAIQQVRVHWLLNLVKIEVIKDDLLKYDFSLLDQFVHLMHRNGLNLGFELMGSPSGLFDDMENKTQVYWWRDLTYNTAQRYVDIYGLDYVRQWNFETWNEPDCHDFDENKMSVQGFLNYYDACSEGLRLVDKTLRFGGPGDGCNRYEMKTKRSKYADALFHHIINGTNFFTGEIGLRMDFLSMHEKGNSDAITILNKELRFAQMLEKYFTKLGNISFYNDEADPLVGWSKPKPWRADSVYAGLVTKVIAQHQNIFKAKANPAIAHYSLLSNDNGFLSYHPYQFTQRTLLARFQINNTNPNYVTFLRKPVYLVSAMLSLLGDRQIYVNVSDDTGNYISNTSDFGILATTHHSPNNLHTSDSWQVAVLVYKTSDPEKSSKYNTSNYVKRPTTLNLNWNIDPPFGTKSLRLMTVTINNEVTNPYAFWVNQLNSTDFPTLAQFAEIRKYETTQNNLVEIPVRVGRISELANIELLDPQVTMFHLCAKPLAPPEMVVGLRFQNITLGQVMVIWSDENIKTKCILTYDVEFSPLSSEGPYHRLKNVVSSITLLLRETGIVQKPECIYRIQIVEKRKKSGIFQYMNLTIR